MWSFYILEANVLLEKESFCNKQDEFFFVLQLHKNYFNFSENVLAFKYYKIANTKHLGRSSIPLLSVFKWHILGTHAEWLFFCPMLTFFSTCEPKKKQLNQKVCWQKQWSSYKNNLGATLRKLTWLAWKTKNHWLQILKKKLLFLFHSLRFLSKKIPHTQNILRT